MEPKRAQSERMDGIVGSILLVGVLLSAGFLLAGILWQKISTGQPALHDTLAGTNLFQFWTTGLRQAIRGQWSPRLFVNAGIALLLMTPYFRVAISTLYFAIAERNKKYTVITGFVLAVLTYSLFVR